ncbi:hypothetical protein TSTA_082220 [Talaromyces stipitatus ATCC 10500]|uniref:Uncharacterized protein n=1 Tax=Talaromyces stipitatus (strain ATCC 10500 / CBS 375.48 / QM 6759 / NRRL 1006) TaxID=441959 RepID=B8M147_TALSN|nr:uncharacterized protein TSTA_082220 [Talaromyces stipitatus ATCC 10500]EED20989.1 hypothetical protein TSTA_082220 [Talaromyces stipitatus ATCC 10500]
MAAYIKQRLIRVRHHGSGIFKVFGTSSCFSVRPRAARKEWQKNYELERKQQQYRDPCAPSSQMKCTYDEVIIDEHFNIRESRHNRWCQKCAYGTYRVHVSRGTLY